MNASRRIPWRSADYRRLGTVIPLAAIPIALNSSIQVKRPAQSIVNLHKVDRAVSDGFRRGHVAGHRLAGLTGKQSTLSTKFASSVTVMPGAGHKFLTLSRTSMAAAVTSGVAAQVLKTMRLATGISTLTFDGKIPASTAKTIQNYHGVWGNQILWGDRVIVDGQTTTLLNGDNIVWRNASAGVNDLQILWGDLSQIGGLGGLTAWSPLLPDSPFASNEPY
jgi:hypothetical protein